MKRPDSSAITIAVCVVMIAILTFTLAFVLNERNNERMVDVTALQDLAQTIQSEYYFYDEKKLDDTKLIDGAMRGMIGTLDDTYAQYFNEEEYNSLLMTNSGDYVGLGISVQTPDETGSQVISVYEGGPADLAGIRPGDIITRVNGKTTAGLSLEELLACFSTDENTADEIVYVRNGQENSVSILRSEVHIKRVTSKTYPGSIGYIRISEFNGSVADDFWNAATTLQEQGVKNLIIDLRDNPGGGFNEVLNVANHLIPEGKVIVTIRSKNGDERVYQSEGSERLNMNLAVLVNDYSASASELLTGALKDYKLAKIVGIRTFGKGIVQSFFHIKENGGWAKFTTDAYYTPNDVCIQGVGISPDLVVDLPEELKSTSVELLDPSQDTQLQAALALFAQQTQSRQTAVR
ncbi:MAG: S41 family peptidase [Christensenella sp.]